jgi:hypothetical protein
MDSVQHLSILHQIVMTYYIYVHCTSSAYFIFYDLLYILMSLWLHFVSTEILTCCKICTHKLASEKCFFSQWLGSILTSHPMTFPSDYMSESHSNHRYKADTLEQLYHPFATSQRQQLYSVCYWIKACVTLCVGKLYDMMTTVQWSDDIIWHKVKNYITITWRYITHSNRMVLS